MSQEYQFQLPLVFQLGVLYRNFMHILLKEMLSNNKIYSSMYFFFWGKNAVALAPREMFLRMCGSIFNLSLLPPA